MDEQDLVEYVGRVQVRTREAAAAIPPDRLHWRPRPAELSAAEIVTHIASTRLMNARRANSGEFRYEGHTVPEGATLESLLALLDASSAQCMELLAGADLTRPYALAGAPPDSRAWRILPGGLIEHEVHHRSQLCSYLAEMGVDPPALFGLHVENLPT